MFRLSKITDYGIVILAHLARDDRGFAGPAAGAGSAAGARPAAPEGARTADGSVPLHNAREVAAAVDLPLPIVSKVMKSLARDGVLKSHRGSKGGFSLTRDPGAITVEEMIAALQGPVALTECNSTADGCQIEGHCPVRDPWQVINRVVQVALSKITLADLIDPSFTSTGTTLQILSRSPHSRVAESAEENASAHAPESAEH